MDTQGGTAGINRLGTRLAAARKAAFVGRSAELELFRTALSSQPPPFAVLHVHGPGGIGKTALLDEFAALAEDDGRRMVRLDGREIAPSPQGLQEGLAEALATDPDDVTAELASGPPPVLLVDSFEHLQAADGWLREALLPQLPDHALVVLAGRNAPSTGWRTDPAWQDLLRVVALRDLRAEEARELLAARGLPSPAQEQVLGVVRGHPLGLVLLADVAHEDDAEVGLQSLADTPEVIDALVTRFVRQVTDAEQQSALHVAAIAGVVTEGLLRDVLGGGARTAFDWVRNLSFVAPVSGGIAIHELAADAISAELRWRDEARWIELHAAITDHLHQRIATSSGAEQQRRQRDLLRLYRHHPVARRFFQLDGDDDRWVGPATPDDHAEIISIAEAHEGEQSAQIVAHWLEQQPEAFWAFRRHGVNEPVGFMTHLLLRGGPSDDVEADPALAGVWEHVRAHAPVRGDESVRVVRHWMTKEDHQAISGHHLVSARASQDWVTTPNLAWAFVLLDDPDLYQPIFEFIDFSRFDWQVDIGEHSFGGFARDMRATSTRDWMELVRDRRAAANSEFAEPVSTERRLLVLAQDDFAEAVRDALRGVARPGGLDGNPLLQSRVVIDAVAVGYGTPERALTRLLHEVTDGLADHPRDAKLHRALNATYLSPAPTQEAAAERLDLPFSTFRRHLTQGIDHVVAHLWDRELHGAS